jgi:hypothetical protein
VRAFVDSIEEGIARILLGEDESVAVTLPASWLPEGTLEGQALKVTWERDEAETANAKKAVADLYAQLGDNP